MDYNLLQMAGKNASLLKTVLNHVQILHQSLPGTSIKFKQIISTFNTKDTCTIQEYIKQFQVFSCSIVGGIGPKRGLCVHFLIKV